MKLVTFIREDGETRVSINPKTVKTIAQAHRGIDGRTPHVLIELTGKDAYYAVRGTVEATTELINEALKDAK
jgi:hypothetical protein